MRVLVTGAAGFIGSHLVRRLSPTNEVVGLDDLSTGLAENLRGVDCRLVVGSILNDAELQAAAEGCDSIVHLAARPSVPRSIADPVASHDVNTTGTLRVLEVARGHGLKHVIVASSSSVYGANPALPKSEDLCVAPVSPYAATKLATESYALAWQHTYGLPVLAFRFFNVFGPRQQPGHAYAAVIPAFVSAALRGENVTIHGDGQQSRDFTYVGTVCDAIAEALDRRVTNPTPVNLAFGTRTSLNSMLDLLEDVLGHRVGRTHVAPRNGDVPHSQADNNLLQSILPGLSPVNVRDGLAQTVAWMRDYLASAVE